MSVVFTRSRDPLPGNCLLCVSIQKSPPNHHPDFDSAAVCTSFWNSLRRLSNRNFASVGFGVLDLGAENCSLGDPPPEPPAKNPRASDSRLPMGCGRDSQRTAANSFTSRHKNAAERMTLTGPHAADAMAQIHAIGLVIPGPAPFWQISRQAAKASRRFLRQGWLRPLE
jgi:hypothetical protein